jgi:hypothetical protein
MCPVIAMGGDLILEGSPQAIREDKKNCENKGENVHFRI